jgi:hypothetical protein
VDFHQNDGSVITNVISNGPSGDEKDLFMTYIFEWRRPEVEAGSEKHQQEYAKFMGMAKEAVYLTISKIRKMVVDGQID